MKNIIKVVLGILLLLILGLVIFAGYLGVFSVVKVSERENGPFTYVYKSFKGPYAQTGPVFDKVYKAALAKGIKSQKGIGIYYDNPQTKPAKALRSDCGLIITDKEVKLAKKLGEEYKIGKLPKAKRAIVEFTIKNAFSYMIGPMKAYPALNNYAKAKKYKTMDIGYEIYMEKNKKVYYLIDLKK